MKRFEIFWDMKARTFEARAVPADSEKSGFCRLTKTMEDIDADAAVEAYYLVRQLKAAGIDVRGGARNA